MVKVAKFGKKDKRQKAHTGKETVINHKEGIKTIKNDAKTFDFESEELKNFPKKANEENSIERGTAHKVISLFEELSNSNLLKKKPFDCNDEIKIECDATSILSGSEALKSQEIENELKDEKFDEIVAEEVQSTDLLLENEVFTHQKSEKVGISDFKTKMDELLSNSSCTTSEFEKLDEQEIQRKHLDHVEKMTEKLRLEDDFCNDANLIALKANLDLEEIQNEIMAKINQNLRHDNQADGELVVNMSDENTRPDVSEALLVASENKLIDAIDESKSVVEANFIIQTENDKKSINETVNEIKEEAKTEIINSQPSSKESFECTSYKPLADKISKFQNSKKSTEDQKRFQLPPVQPKSAGKRRTARQHTINDFSSQPLHINEPSTKLHSSNAFTPKVSSVDFDIANECLNTEIDMIEMAKSSRDANKNTDITVIYTEQQEPEQPRNWFRSLMRLLNCFGA